MSQDPLARLRRTERREPRAKASFPDERYRASILETQHEFGERRLSNATLCVYRAQAVLLAERRIVEAGVAGAMLSGLNSLDEASTAGDLHLLAGIEAMVVDAAGSVVQLGSGREEIMLTAMRIVLRERLLAFAEATLGMRAALSSVALQHLTTMLLATSNGQVVQPTSLGHYLTGQLGPLQRTSQRTQEAFARLNQSPMGSVSGMATAVPILRGRLATLLGFDGPIESTFDAIANGDVLAEIASVVAMLAVELSRLVADLSYWARDEVGTMAPSDAYVHRNVSQPQRRDPLVLDHLRAKLTALATVPGQLSMLLAGRHMLGGEAGAAEAFRLVEQQFGDAVTVLETLGDVLTTSEVHRALFAHRSNRGFATSSELADLLTIDFEIPRDEAVQLAERVVIESTEAGGEAVNLKTELIDSVALRLRGVEIGIEPEMLAKVLSPKRFIERRDHPGGPAPSSVRASLERESLAIGHARDWVEERRNALSTAAAELDERAREIATDPEAALQRGRR